MLLQPIVLFLLSALALPVLARKRSNDLYAHYYLHTRWFFGLAVGLIVVSLLRDLVIAGHLPGALNLSAHVLLFAAWGTAALTARPWYHRGVVAFTSLLILAYIGALFGRLS